jgi:hypothetical protein
MFMDVLTQAVDVAKAGKTASLPPQEGEAPCRNALPGMSLVIRALQCFTIPAFSPVQAIID